MPAAPTIRSGTARAYTIPTDASEADGTIAWNSTTLVVVSNFMQRTIAVGMWVIHTLTESPLLWSRGS